jgi:hypothetical protein
VCGMCVCVLLYKFVVERYIANLLRFFGCGAVVWLVC